MVQDTSGPSYHRLIVLPDGRVARCKHPEIPFARLLQRSDAILAVMLQVRQADRYRVGRTLAEAIHREMVVQRYYPLRIVETLDVLAGLGVVLAPINMRHHVQVMRDAPLEREDARLAPVVVTSAVLAITGVTAVDTWN